MLTYTVPICLLLGDMLSLMLRLFFFKLFSLVGVVYETILSETICDNGQLRHINWPLHIIVYRCKKIEKELSSPLYSVIYALKTFEEIHIKRPLCVVAVSCRIIKNIRQAYSFLDCSSHIKTNIIWQEHNVQIIKVIGMLNHTHLSGLGFTMMGTGYENYQRVWVSKVVNGSIIHVWWHHRSTQRICILTKGYFIYHNM